MIRRTIALLGVFVVAASSAAVAGAKTTHTTKHKATKHALNIKGTLHKVTSTTAGTVAFAGTVTGSGGKGTVTVSQKVTGATTSVSTSVTKYKKGSLTTIFNVTETKTATGSFTLSGTGKFTKGTGIYKKAKGKGALKLTGTASSDLSAATLHVTGTLVY